MERPKKTPLLQCLLLAVCLFCTVRTDQCDSNNIQHDPKLTCYNDYNCVITCVWNNTDESDLTGHVCTIHAKRVTGKIYKSSCDLKPINISRPEVKKCDLIFEKKYIFQTFQEYSINVTCNSQKRLIRSYTPKCHIKLNPPGKPEINFTSISWLITKHIKFDQYNSELEWKRKSQSWSDLSVQEEKRQAACGSNCETNLDPDLLIKGETYESRARVRPVKYGSTWSDWSPTASWVSQIGQAEKSDVAGGFWSMAATGTAAFTLFLAFILFRSNKTPWVYIVKKFRGPPLPNPAMSFLQDINFHSSLSSHFTRESFNSFFKPVEFISVEVTCNVDGVEPSGAETALLEKMRNESSYDSSSFSNPSYSHLDPPPPVTSLTAGNLEPCASDSPYGPVRGQSESKTTEQEWTVEEKGKQVEIQQLLSKGSSNTELMQVVLDYNKVEKLESERVRLESLDSAMCSGEELSLESLEADSISVIDRHDDESQGKEEREGENGKDDDFRMLLGNISKGSIQVCSDYERVQKLQADSSESFSLDSDVGSGSEEQASQEESLEDIDKPTESTHFLFPPHPPTCSASPCIVPFFPPLPCSFSGPVSLTSTCRSVEPCGDGYMPARQKGD